jgi:hypothetical protein
MVQRIGRNKDTISAEENLFKSIFIESVQVPAHLFHCKRFAADQPRASGETPPRHASRFFLERYDTNQN